MKTRRKKSGVVLLVVLWVLVIFSSLVLALSYEARGNISRTITHVNFIQGRRLAEAGVARALAEILFRKREKESAEDAWRLDGTFYEGDMETGRYRVSIRDEAGKVDINFAPEVLLRNLIRYGLGRDEIADEVVDSILDWRDRDELHRLEGAESDYYRSLPNPYDAKNGPFSTVEELSMVRGIDDALLFGKGEMTGLLKLVTVHAKTGRVNIASAPEEVLRALPGATDDFVETVMALRESGEESLVEKLVEAFPGVMKQASPYITTAESGIYSIESWGIPFRSQTAFVIRTSVRVQEGGSFTYLSYKSPAEIVPVEGNGETGRTQ